MIAIGGFPHIVAASVEAFLLLVSGELGFGHKLVGFPYEMRFGCQQFLARQIRSLTFVLPPLGIS